MEYVLLALVSCVFIFAKAFQQLNVVFKKTQWVPPMSFVMAACEVFVIVNVVQTQNWLTVLSLGTGASIGCLGSMAVHERLTGKGYGTNRSKHCSS